MKKTTIIWLVIACFLLIAGLIMFVAAMAKCNWNFYNLDTEKYETNTYEIKEDFSNLSINTDTADIVFALSDNGECRVECYEGEKVKHIVKVEEDTLNISVTDNGTWYDRLGIRFNSPRITVYLPKEEYADLSINEDTGDINIPKDFRFDVVNISLSTGDVDYFASHSNTVKIKTSTGNIKINKTYVNYLNLSTSTGNIKIENVSGKSIISKGSTGKITLKNTLVAENINIKRSTGNVQFENSDAAEIFVKTSTGDVTGTLCTEKTFFTKSSTGTIDVPKTTSPEKCDVTTSTGDIILKISNS